MKLYGFIINLIILLYNSQETEFVTDHIIESEHFINNTNKDYESIETPEINDEQVKLREAEYNFSKEWSRTMYDYEPSYVYMFPVERKSTQVYYETITKSARVRGAFLLSGESGKKEPIEFQINDPTDAIVYKNNTISGIFSFQANLLGEYTVKIKNNSPKDSALVTFTMNTYQEEVLSKEHLSYSEEKLTNLMRFIRSIRAEEGFTRQFVRNKKKSKYISIINLVLSKNNRYVFSFIVIETAVLIGISVFQFFYIKKLVKNN